MVEHSFQEVVRQWDRLCESRHRICYDTEGKCPLYYFSCNNCMSTINSIINAESIIMDWVEKHPEPIYPTWGEWLNSITHQMVDGDLLDSPIPAGMAQKLGVKPIE